MTAGSIATRPVATAAFLEKRTILAVRSCSERIHSKNSVRDRKPYLYTCTPSVERLHPGSGYRTRTQDFSIRHQLSSTQQKKVEMPRIPDDSNFQRCRSQGILSDIYIYKCFVEYCGESNCGENTGKCPCRGAALNAPYWLVPFNSASKTAFIR
jgi:hypothetical protein